MLDEYRIEPMTVGQYLDAVYNEYIKIDQAVQREFCWTYEMMNSLIYSASSRKIYIPSIILAEEKKPNGAKQTYVIDAGQRTETLYRFRYEGYRISSAIRNYMVTYNKKKVKEDGEYARDEYGDIEFELVEYDIRRTTYEEWPEELKNKLNGCPLTTVIYQDCTPDETSELVLLYNNHIGMNVSQKALTYVGKFAEDIKSIKDNNDFLKDCTTLNENEKKKGVWERVISESVMIINHFEDWKKAPKNMCDYLNNNSTEDEFKDLGVLMNRLIPFSDKLENPEIASLFSSKNLFIWMKLFSEFDTLNLSDMEFGRFLKSFAHELKSIVINGEDWEIIDSNRNTKDKSIIVKKVEYLEKLMMDFLNIEESETEKNKLSPEQFVSDNAEVNIETVRKDFDFYNQMLDDLEDRTIKDGSKLLYPDNRLSLLSLVAYSMEKEIDLDDWMLDYAKKNNTYYMDQKKNFLHMKQDLEKFLNKKVVAA